MRENRFTFLCNQFEKEQLVHLAAVLQRSQGDTIRWLLERAYRKYVQNDGTDQPQRNEFIEGEQWK